MRLGWTIALAAALLAAAGPAGAKSLRFQDVFRDRGEPASLHYSVAYRSGGAVHRMEVWRDGDRRLRRNTDQAITTFAFHQPGEAGYQLSILDRQKRVHTRIDRTNLYRIGEFTDWFDLAHGLRHPRGDYAPGQNGLRRGHPGDPAVRVVRPDRRRAHHPDLLGRSRPDTLADRGRRRPAAVAGRRHRQQADPRQPVSRSTTRAISATTPIATSRTTESMAHRPAPSGRLTASSGGA